MVQLMGRTTVDLPDDLEQKFRTQIVKKYGGEKGALKKAVKEAVELWIDKQKEKEE